MLKLLIRLSTLSLGISCVLCTSSSSQSQLASLNDRMSQMLSALYASPLLSKSSSTTSDEEVPTSSPETSYTYTVAPSAQPQFVFVTPPNYLETGAQPTEYGYPTETHSVTTRSAWPYPYEYAYPPQYLPPAYPAAISPYPEPPRAAYPQVPSPAFNPLLSPAPYQSPLPYPTPSPYSAPPAYSSLPFAPPQLPPTFPQVPPLPYSPAPPFPSYPTCSPPIYPSLGYSSPALPALGYPAGYPLSIAPPLPTPGFPAGYPPIPSPAYPPSSYPSSMYSSSPFSPPAYPKYSDVLHHPFNIART